MSSGRCKKFLIEKPLPIFCDFETSGGSEHRIRDIGACVNELLTFSKTIKTSLNAADLDEFIKFIKTAVETSMMYHSVEYTPGK